MSWFGRKKQQEVDLTREAYGRWIRAQRPQPIAWFLAQSEDHQEAMAEVGDEYTEDLCVSMGIAIADPIAADAGLDADTNTDSEELLVRKLAAGAIARHLQGGQESPSRPVEPIVQERATMGGISQRRQEASEKREQQRHKGRSFLGSAPEEATA